ncbi:hypothetical protein CRUP_009820 [Coryphaenoides rupestris]|nr:hypothetical protein CRUP_009820 [Coryphaenoides rupestris]
MQQHFMEAQGIRTPREVIAVMAVPVYCLLSSLLIPGVALTCVPTQCLNCDAPATVQPMNNSSDLCDLCPNITSPCINDFWAYMNSSSGYDLKEGGELVLNCHHNLPPQLDLYIEWQRDGRTVVVQTLGETLSWLALKSTEGSYRCVVHSFCGNATSNAEQVDVNAASKRHIEQKRAQMLQMTTGMAVN